MGGKTLQRVGAELSQSPFAKTCARRMQLASLPEGSFLILRPFPRRFWCGRFLLFLRVKWIFPESWATPQPNKNAIFPNYCGLFAGVLRVFCGRGKREKGPILRSHGHIGILVVFRRLHEKHIDTQESKSKTRTTRKFMENLQVSACPNVTVRHLRPPRQLTKENIGTPKKQAPSKTNCAIFKALPNKPPGGSNRVGV